MRGSPASLIASSNRVALVADPGSPDTIVRNSTLACGVRPNPHAPMKLFRSVLFWCHLTVGLSVAVVVVIMSATGVALTYQKQMTAWADARGLDGAPPQPGAQRLPIDSLLH